MPPLLRDVARQRDDMLVEEPLLIYSMLCYARHDDCRKMFKIVIR